MKARIANCDGIGHITRFLGGTMVVEWRNGTSGVYPVSDLEFCLSVDVLGLEDLPEDYLKTVDLQTLEDFHQELGKLIEDIQDSNH